jgi:hypothetical protein
MNNHYHALGYQKTGKSIGPMMQRIHGSVAKLVNDQSPERISPFWYDTGRQGYFDGCLRDETQARRTYRYILTQCRRHGICHNPADYPHTRIHIEMECAIKRATELNAFMYGVGYKRYEK